VKFSVPRNIARTAGAAVLVVAALGMTQPAQAAPAAETQGTTAQDVSVAQVFTELSRGQRMNKGDELVRTTAAYLIMQDDGNLVLYTRSGRRACWSTGTRGTGAWAQYKSDGNFVVIGNHGREIWWSGRKAGETVDINSEGRLYVGHTPITGPCLD
jgi:hypothetical protein